MTINTLENQLQSIAINGHYIKELYFDNMNAPASFAEQATAPRIEIAINFNNRSLKGDLYEVVLSIKTQATSTDESTLTLFDLRLSYAGLFTINNIKDEDQKEVILMIHFPTLLFPYARRILSDITRDGGFQPLMLEHMDFAMLYQKRKIQKEVVEFANISVN